MTASLWSRRRMSVHGEAPANLPPLISLTIKDSNTANPSLSIQSASTPSYAPFSPSLCTPTLDGSPQQASVRARQAVAASFAWSDPSPTVGSVPLVKHAAWLTITDTSIGDMLAQQTTAEIKANLRIEIDMAALATEMALHTLDSDSDTSADSFTCAFKDRMPARSDSRQRSARLRLLPDTVLVVDDVDDLKAIQRPTRDRSGVVEPSLFSGTTLTESSSYGQLSPCTPLETGALESQTACSGGSGSNDSQSSFTQTHVMELNCHGNDKPVRKGRARMSQEKRRRLARRREREAMLLALSPRSASAPALQASFVAQQTFQKECNKLEPPSILLSREAISNVSFVRSTSNPVLPMAGSSQASNVSAFSKSHGRDLLHPPSHLAPGMVRRASAPSPLQYSGSKHHWRGAVRGPRPLQYHHVRQEQSPQARSVSLSVAKPTIIARSPVFGSWPSLVDASMSWRTASACTMTLEDHNEIAERKESGVMFSVH